MTNDTHRPSQVPRFAQWRALVLIACSIGSGLVLDTLVLGSGPSAPVEAVEAVAASSPVVSVGETTTTVPLVPAPTTIAASVSSSTTPTVATTEVVVAQASQPAGSATVRPSPIPAAAAPTPTTSPPATSPSSVAPSAQPQPTPPSTAAPPSPAPTASSGPPATPPPATSPPAATTYPSYAVPNVGDVVLAFSDANTIRLWSVAPSAQWVYEVERDGPRSVVVKFFNAGTHDEAEFQAEIEGSRIKVEYGG